MNDYLFLMRDDGMSGSGGSASDYAWEPYLASLRTRGRFEGGSSVGSGLCVSKSGTSATITSHITGYLKVRADNLEDARRLLDGNPVFEAGGTIEIRELPISG